MKNLVAGLLLVFGVQGAMAQYTDAAVEIGFRQQSGDIDGAGDTKSKVGYQGGVSAAFPISGALNFRTGLFYNEKAIKVENAGDIKFTTFDVPAALLYKFADYAGVYGGVNLSVNLDDSCPGGSCRDVKSFTTPLIIGATFKFASQLGANVFFESYSGELADGVKDFKAVGVNLMITFD